MIKIDTKQRKQLMDICEEFDERPIKNKIIVSRVREHKMIQIETTDGWKSISMPDPDDNPREGRTPVFCGVVLAIRDDNDTTLKRGDLIRFSPLGAEEVMSGNSSYAWIIISEHEVRSVSHNVFTGNADQFCEPPPTDTKLN